MLGGQNPNALIAFKGSLKESGIMEAGEQGEIIHRITADAVIEIDEGADLMLSAEDVPEGEVLVNEATRSEVEKGSMSLNLDGDLVFSRGGEEAS
jgi:hypothetical protein